MTEYQTGLRRMPPGFFDLDGHLARLDADGFTIVKDYLGEDQLARFREDLKPYLNAYRGRNSFEGLATERVYRWWGAAEYSFDLRQDLWSNLAPGHYVLSTTPGKTARAAISLATHLLRSAALCRNR
jgi:hypothetical protein